MRIYFADDEADERDIMAATLASGGYADVHFSASGRDLLSKIGIAPVSAEVLEPDLILLDVRMPGIDGVETCARIRADPRYQQTPILMVTSMDDLETLNHAFLAGANDYINKPYNRIELLARLRAAARLKGELDRRVARERELLAAQEVRGLRPRDANCAIDPVTSLLPRQIMEGYVSTEGAARQQGLGALAILIDNLQGFEKSYGPVAKRDLLRLIAVALTHLPGYVGDLLSHFDLGLFVVLTHNTERPGVAAMADLAERAVRDLAVPHRGARPSNIVTVSIGVAHDREPRALLAAAVSAAEQAAGEGGNRILFA